MPANTTILQSGTLHIGPIFVISSPSTMPQANIPTHIADGVRVQEWGGDGCIGTVIGAAGQQQWNVKFDGNDVLEIKSSAGALKIYQEGYGKLSKPKHPAARSIPEAKPKTGRGKHYSQNSAVQSDDEDV